MQMIAVALVALAAIALTSVAAGAGYAIVDQQGSTTLVSRGRIKQLSREPEQAVMAFDAARDRLWLANPRTRSYWEGTSEEFCTAVKSMRDGGLAAMESTLHEQLAKLPPEQRAVIAERMRQARGGTEGEPSPSVAVERTSEEASVGGQTARKFRVLANGQPAMDVWLGSPPGLVAELMLATTSERYGRLAACGAGTAGARQSAAVYDSAEFRGLYALGWPLRVVTYARGAPRTAIDVVRIEQRDVPDAEFSPPAGFRKAGLGAVFGATGRAPRR
jgi:hypothetical protein